MSKYDKQWTVAAIAIVVVMLIVFVITLHTLANSECERAGFDAGHYKTSFNNDLHIVCEYRTSIDLSDVLREE